MSDNSRSIVPVGQRVVVASVTRQITITEKLLANSQEGKAENLKSLVDLLCHATVWEDRERAWLILRKMGPIDAGWIKLLQNAIYTGDGWARILASESLSLYGCLPNDTIPVFVEVIKTGIDSLSFDWVCIACSAIGKYRNVSDEYVRMAIPPLIKALECSDENISLYAAGTLCGFDQMISNDIQLSIIQKKLKSVTDNDSGRLEFLQEARKRLLLLVTEKLLDHKERSNLLQTTLNNDHHVEEIEKRQLYVVIGNFDDYINEVFADCVKEVINDKYNLEVRWFWYGEDLLEQAKKGAGDIFVLILNNIMYRSPLQDLTENSVQLITQIKKIRSSPVISLLGYSDPTLEEQVKQAGSDFFFPLPFKVEAFMEAIEKCLDMLPDLNEVPQGNLRKVS